MILFSFVGGAAAYRANVHIAVQMLTDAVPAQAARRALLLLADLAMVATALFMMIYDTSSSERHLEPDDRRVPDPVGGASRTCRSRWVGRSHSSGSSNGSGSACRRRPR